MEEYRSACIYIYILQSRTLLRISKGIISHVLKVCKIAKITAIFIDYYIHFFYHLKMEESIKIYVISGLDGF